MGGISFVLYAACGWTTTAAENSYTTFTVPGLGWQVGGVFVIVFVTSLVGLLFFIALRVSQPDFFKGRTLTRSTPTMVSDE